MTNEITLNNGLHGQIFDADHVVHKLSNNRNEQAFHVINSCGPPLLRGFSLPALLSHAPM